MVCSSKALGLRHVSGKHQMSAGSCRKAYPSRIGKFAAKSFPGALSILGSLCGRGQTAKGQRSQHDVTEEHAPESGSLRFSLPPSREKGEREIALLNRLSCWPPAKSAVHFGFDERPCLPLYVQPFAVWRRAPIAAIYRLDFRYVCVSVKFPPPSNLSK